MYTAEISRNNPGCFILLVDRSGSMDEQIAGAEIVKAQAVSDTVNRLLQNLVIKCSKGDEIRNYFEIGVIGYGLRDQQQIAPIFVGAMTGQNLVTISDIAANPAELENRTKKVSDGTGGLVETQVKFPIWFKPSAEGGTPMTSAFQYVHQILEPWVQQHPDAFPPIVIHITDGQSTDGDPTQAAQKVASLTTNDGNVLILNCHISHEGGQVIVFPSKVEGISDPFAKMLCNISSELPEGILKAAKAEGFDVQPGSRGFTYNADLVQLIQFLDIGTRPANNLR